MTYENFEDTPVWQEAARLYELTEDFLENSAFRASGAFRDQLDRAALSVSNNIAEGFERGTTNELLYFLYIARGSAGEARSILHAKPSLRWIERQNWAGRFGFGDVQKPSKLSLPPRQSAISCPISNRIGFSPNGIRI